MVLRTIGPMEPLHPGFAYFPLKSRQGFRERDPRFRYQMYQLLARTHIKRNLYISHRQALTDIGNSLSRHLGN